MEQGRFGVETGFRNRAYTDAQRRLNELERDEQGRKWRSSRPSQFRYDYSRFGTGIA
jgi:hypothetical protein